jgi:hypothetical protein
MTPGLCMFPSLRTCHTESSPSNAHSASGSYKPKGSTHGGNTFCQTSELTFVCPQAATLGSSRINLRGKHTMSNATNANGAVPNVRLDHSLPPQDCRAIYVLRMRWESFPKMLFTKWSTPCHTRCLKLLQTVPSATLNTMSGEKERLRVKTCCPAHKSSSHWPTTTDTWPSTKNSLPCLPFLQPLREASNRNPIMVGVR